MSTKQQVFWVGAAGLGVGTAAGVVGAGALIPATVGLVTLIVLALGAARMARPLARLAGPGRGPEVDRIAARICQLETQLEVATDGLEAVASALRAGRAEPFTAWWRTHERHSPLRPELLEHVLRQGGPSLERLRELSDTTEQMGGQAERALGRLDQMGSDLDAISEALRTAHAGAEGLEASAKKSDAHAQAADGETRALHAHLASLEARIRELSELALNIAGVTKGVQDMAYRTNLAALNASVEAAKAGDQGQGFAAVARELQVLSERCSVTAQETAEVLDGADRMALDTRDLAGGALSQAGQLEASVTRLGEDLLELTAGLGQVEAHLGVGVSRADRAHAHAERLCRELEVIELHGREASASASSVMPPPLPPPEDTRELPRVRSTTTRAAPAAFMPSAMGASALEGSGVSTDGLTFDLDPPATLPPEA